MVAASSSACFCQAMPALQTARAGLGKLTSCGLRMPAYRLPTWHQKVSSAPPVSGAASVFSLRDCRVIDSWPWRYSLSCCSCMPDGLNQHTRNSTRKGFAVRICPNFVLEDRCRRKNPRGECPTSKISRGRDGQASGKAERGQRVSSSATSRFRLALSGMIPASCFA